MRDRIWPSPCGFQIRSRIEALLEHDIKLVSGSKPFPHISTCKHQGNPLLFGMI